ncbi:MAG: NAD(P) transhydrogenase subunit alpha [Alphaproteobacteria bacterium]|nr:NAD(P) transhydrogenase subunit alpha [Alphaproteobacteria bacterium]
MSEKAQTFQESLSVLAQDLQNLAQQTADIAERTAAAAPHSEPFLITGLTVFVLACFVGYHVVWRVTPALHSPLMGITNAISSVIIVGAVLATGTHSVSALSSVMGFLAVIFASVNIFGGFIITQRMLHMFKKKER